MKNLHLQMLYSMISLSWLGVFLMVSILTLTILGNTGRTLAELDPTNEIQAKPIVSSISDSLQTQFDKGKTLFKTNCASCHHKNMIDDLTGPALKGVTERWAAFPPEDLYRWIRNAQKLIDQKHPQALAIWKEWDKKPMSTFTQLTDSEIESILAYIENQY